MRGWRAQLDAALGHGAYRLDALHGGCVGSVWLVTGERGPQRVAKSDETGDGGLAVEGAMLRYLAAHTDLPVPEVLHASPELLLMSRLPGTAGCASAAEPHAAALVASLHAHHADRFGFGHDTRIGGLVQPNPWTASWLEFFGQHRLGAMARACVDVGRLDAALAARVERLAGRLGEWLDEPGAPSLVHGDLWSGNLLSEGAAVTGVLDPAIHFGHPEVELAFATMFGTFTDRFYAAYGEQRGRLDADFFAVRRHVYNVYPLLVHVRLFGGGYVATLRDVLRRLVG